MLRTVLDRQCEQRTAGRVGLLVPPGSLTRGWIERERESERERERERVREIERERERERGVLYVEVHEGFWPHPCCS